MKKNLLQFGIYSVLSLVEFTYFLLIFKKMIKFPLFTFLSSLFNLYKEQFPDWRFFIVHVFLYIPLGISVLSLFNLATCNITCCMESQDLVILPKKDTLLPSGILQREEMTVSKEDSGIVITKKMSLLKLNSTEKVPNTGGAGMMSPTEGVPNTGGAGIILPTDGVSSTPVKKGDSWELLQDLSQSAEELKKAQVKNTAAQGLHVMSTRVCAESVARLHPPLSIFTCSGSASIGMLADQTESSLTTSQSVHTEAKAAIDSELKLRLQKGEALGKLEVFSKK